uniref:Uncharacterized protein n=1 Tax=viral metagenome TaxID=1070528 RepID=A0A6C0BQ92_9ZZZZ
MEVPQACDRCGETEKKALMVGEAKGDVICEGCLNIEKYAHPFTQSETFQLSLNRAMHNAQYPAGYACMSLLAILADLIRLNQQQQVLSDLRPRFIELGTSLCQWIQQKPMWGSHSQGDLTRLHSVHQLALQVSQGLMDLAVYKQFMVAFGQLLLICSPAKKP